MAHLAPFVRIILRYIAGVLIARGYFGEGDASLFMDEEIIGLIVMLLNEAWYYAARRWGWEK